MDSKQMFATFVFMAMALLPTTIHAIEYTVGDDDGWTDNFDYQAWTSDKQFKVGDILVFKYEVGKHDVIEVTPAEFLACMAFSEPEPPVTSGEESITLLSEGYKFYICGKDDGKHCSLGQRLVIDVLPAINNINITQEPSPSPVHFHLLN
ncbi:Cupredoxins domain-containing protein [Dioscorea alata]|uniref:Cupredoxins domain-containing protein n=1 Tax=Dioscorea alata TaxID=55571 RepID=A0ACB7UMD4_DIOAL|nr:Cupredoxins domain-containing protein [Dioscorea alata]